MWQERGPAPTSCPQTQTHTLNKWFGSGFGFVNF